MYVHERQRKYKSQEQSPSTTLVRSEQQCLFGSTEVLLDIIGHCIMDPVMYRNGLSLIGGGIEI
jgi:hypothetical protein